jgi:nitroreductase
MLLLRYLFVETRAFLSSKISGFRTAQAASENMLLVAHDLGLGAGWIGIYPSENMTREVGRLLNIPENVTPFSIIGMGYPAEEKSGRLRYDTSRIHSNSW